MLLSLTLIINFISLAMALWLGLYVVTRSPRRLIAWLTGFTLWTIAGLFINALLALNPPPELATPPTWISYFLPFWQTSTFKEQAAHSWLVGAPWLMAAPSAAISPITRLQSAWLRSYIFCSPGF